VEPLIPPSPALTVVLPCITAVATPCEPTALEMVAVPMSAVVHVTWLVRSWVLPSV
jgi:hypothetical protein